MTVWCKQRYEQKLQFKNYSILSPPLRDNLRRKLFLRQQLFFMDCFKSNTHSYQGFMDVLRRCDVAPLSTVLGLSVLYFGTIPETTSRTRQLTKLQANKVIERALMNKTQLLFHLILLIADCVWKATEVSRNRAGPAKVIRTCAHKLSRFKDYLWSMCTKHNLKNDKITLFNLFLFSDKSNF